MTSPYHFANVLVNIQPNNKTLSILKIYAKRAAENVKGRIFTPRKLRLRLKQKQKVGKVFLDSPFTFLYKFSKIGSVIKYIFILLFLWL